MNSQELVHIFLEVADKQGVETARAELERRREFLRIDINELELAIACSIEMARGSKTERYGYWLVVCIGVAAAILNGYVLLTSSTMSGFLKYLLCGVVAGSVVLVLQYSKYLFGLAQNSRRVGVLCHELKLVLGQLHEVG